MSNCNGKVHGRNWILHLSDTTVWIIREDTFFLGCGGLEPQRGGSHTRRGSHTFHRIYYEDGQVAQNPGRILPKGDWKSEYYRLLDLESTQVRNLSKWYFLVGFLAHHVLFMWPRNLDLSISRDALGRTRNNNKVLHHLLQTLRIQYMITFPD